MKLTPAGWAVLTAAAACYAAAVATGYPELGEIAAGGAVAVAVAVAWVLPVPRLDVSREIAPARVARGDPAVGVVTVTSAGHRVRAGLRATDPCGDRAVAVDIPRLSPGRGRTVSYRLPTQRRGEIPVGPLRVTRCDLLGLARRERQYGEPVTLIVRPQIYPLPLLPSGRAHHLEGPASDNVPSGTVTFHALREYVPGDDLRHIHWRATARTGTLMVRQLVDASLPRTTVVLDLRPASYLAADEAGHRRSGDGGQAASERFEAAVDAAASVMMAVARQGFPVRVLSTAGPLLESKGDRAGAGALLDRFAPVVPSAAGSLAAPLAVCHGRGEGSLVVVTGNLDPAETGQVAAAGAGFEHTVLIRLAAAAGASPTPRGVAVIDAGGPAGIRAGWQQAAGGR